MYYMSNKLMALAIIPGLLIIIYVYTKDKVEKEPIGVILKCLFFGVLSCFVAAYAEQFLEAFLPAREAGTLPYALQTSFCVAAFCEEIVKYLATRLGSWKSPAFNYRFDGIVYAVSAAVGFAVYENINYVAMYGLQTAIVRAFTAVPLHAFCGVFMGVFYGIAKKASILGKGGASKLATLLALLVPMLIHGCYDTLAFWRMEYSTILLLAFVVVLYIAGIKTINRMSAEDRLAGFYPEARTFEYDSRFTEGVEEKKPEDIDFKL